MGIVLSILNATLFHLLYAYIVYFYVFYLMTYIARAVAALKQHNYKLTLKRQLALQYIESSQ